MRRALVALLLAAAGLGAAAAPEIRSYETRVAVDASGDAQISARLQLEGALPGRLRVPVGFGGVKGFAAGEAPAGTTMAWRGQGGAGWVEVDLPEGVPPTATIGFAARVPGLLVVPKVEEGQKPTLPDGSRLLRHAFVNTQEAAIGRYVVTVLLPDDALVHRVREQSPATRRKEFVPRVELDRFDGRQGARLQLATMKQGDRTAMELEVVSAQRSWAWWLLAVLAVGYLVAFRDLVQAPRGGTAQPG